MMSSWIPNENDKKFINSLMVRVDTPGKYASWISLLIEELIIKQLILIILDLTKQNLC